MVFEFVPGSGKTERGPLIVPRRAADVSVRARECHAGPNQVGAFAELIVRWIAALVPFRRVAASGLFIGGLGDSDARARLVRPKNRGPDQCAPVICSAITVSDR
jgi:hypothetical protein